MMEYLEKNMLNKLIQYYKILKKIICNGDKLHMSNYQKTSILLLGIKPRLLTAYQLKQINK